jgi:hypothetical protein
MANGTKIDTPDELKRMDRLSNAQGAGSSIARIEAGGKTILKPWSGLRGFDIRDRSQKGKIGFKSGL